MNITLKSERMINYLVEPVINSGGSKNFPYKTENAVYYKPVNARTFMFLDVIAEKVIEKWKSQYIYKDDPFGYFQSLGTFYITLELDDFYEFEFLRRFKPSELIHYLKESSIKISNHKIYYRKNGEIDSKGIQRYNKVIFQQNGNPTNLFEVLVHGKLIKLYFTSVMGHVFLNNIILKNYDIINSKIFDLKPTTQLLYRKMFLSKWKSERIRFSRKDVVEKLLLTSKNNTVIDNIIEKGLNELKNCELIDRYDYENSRKGIKFFKVFSHNTKDNSKKKRLYKNEKRL